MTSVYFENQPDPEVEEAASAALSDKADKNQPPKKFKYLWLFVTGPARYYRRFEWWCIKKFLATKDFTRERVTLKLHQKYRDNKCLALLYYFHDLAKEDNLVDQHLDPDMDKITQLIDDGADVHACDDIGQNLMHEIARYHGAEVCFFFLNYSVNINLEDDYSCTPLHVSAAYNNSAIVEILASNGGELESTTFYMLQTPLHYAARYDSPSSVKKLVEMGAVVEARDYRGRTPLLLAAELGRVAAGAVLVECGAKVYAIDFTGMYGLSAMVNKCPPLALKALDTCVQKDLRNRKQYFSLQFLEPIALCNDECARTTLSVLEETVRAGSDNLDIIKHPMIQKMIEVKWKQFGKRGYIKELVAYVIVLINWSLLCLFNPIQGSQSNATNADGTTDTSVSDFSDYTDYIAVGNEIITVLFFLYQVFDESREMKTNMRRHKNFVAQRLKQLTMEFKYLELLSTEEKEYLSNEQTSVRKSASNYTNDMWNVFDWLSLILMFGTLTTHFVIKYAFSEYAITRGQLLSITLIIVWFKLFKYCRVLETLGPFCVIVSSLPKDFVKIVMVYVILYIPIVCTFYHFYTGDYSDDLTEDEDFEAGKYGSFEQTCFTVFLYTLVDDYGYDTLIKIGAKRSIYQGFTHLLIAYWIVVSAVLLLNIFIALMSDTFSRVYENALVVAQFERAAMIVSIENKLPDYWRKHYLIDISYNYSPACEVYDEDDVPDDDEETFEKDIVQAHNTLRKITLHLKEKKDGDLMEFVREKIKIQNQLISAIIEKIEEIHASRSSKVEESPALPAPQESPALPAPQESPALPAPGDTTEQEEREPGSDT